MSTKKVWRPREPQQTPSSAAQEPTPAASSENKEKKQKKTHKPKHTSAKNSTDKVQEKQIIHPKREKEPSVATEGHSTLAGSGWIHD